MSPVHSSLYSGWFIIGYYEMYWHLYSPAGLLSERAVWHVGHMDYSHHCGVTLQTCSTPFPACCGAGCCLQHSLAVWKLGKLQTLSGTLFFFSLCCLMPPLILCLFIQIQDFSLSLPHFFSYFPLCPFFFSSLSLSLYFSSSIERVSVYAQTHHFNDSIT